MILEILSEIFDDIDTLHVVDQVQDSETNEQQLFDLDYLIESDYPDPDLDEDSRDLDFVEWFWVVLCKMVLKR